MEPEARNICKLQETNTMLQNIKVKAQWSDLCVGSVTFQTALVRVIVL